MAYWKHLDEEEEPKDISLITHTREISFSPEYKDRFVVQHS